MPDRGPAEIGHRGLHRPCGILLLLGGAYVRNLIMNSSVSPFLSLSTLIRCLRGSVGGWGLRGWLGVALSMLLYRRLGEIAGRMERLAARFAAGRLWRLEGRARGAAQAVGKRRAGGTRIWPGGFGWLVKAASWQAAGYGSQLRAVLETPDMVALLAAAPQARRVLLPLCRMLAVDAALLRPADAGAVAPDEVAPRLGPARKKRAARAMDRDRVPISRPGLASGRPRGWVTS